MIIGQVTLFVILVFVGILAVKVKVLNQEAFGYFSKFLMRFAIPSLLFYNTVNGATRKELIESLNVILISLLMFAGLAAMGVLVSKLLGLKGNEKRMYQVASAFGNIGFMGIPLVAAIFPKTGMLYIALFTIVDQSLLWTIGMQMTYPAGEKRKISFGTVLKKMVSPATVAIALSILFVLIGIKLPETINNALGSLAGTTSPLSMIYIGGMFCYTDMKKYLKRIDFYVLVVTKMILYPIGFYLLLKLMPITEEIRITITILSALPQMSTIPMFANANGSDGEYAMGSLMVTTLFSAVTLPMIGYLIPML